jgi:toxin-antitoxin system PIN domain toxin
MTSFFPDLNVWIALSDSAHSHHSGAWRWLTMQPDGARLIFSRYTQVGLLRLLSNVAVMGDAVLTVRHAWRVYDRWLDDPRVEYYPEPRGLDAAFREATGPLGARAASKWIGDCFLLAHAKASGSSLVTFDKALKDFAWKHDYAAILPD